MFPLTKPLSLQLIRLHGGISNVAPRTLVKALTLLPSDASTRLAAAAGGPGALVRTDNDESFMETFAAMSPNIVVVDPKLIAPGRVQNMVALFGNAQTHVIVYTSLTPDGIQAALPFVRTHAAEVILRGYDDGHIRLQHILTAGTRQSAAEKMIRMLRPVTVELPPQLRESVEAMFRDSGAIDSAKRLAAAANMTRRSLDRWIERSGIASVRLLVAAPKILRAYAFLKQPGTSVARAASILGFSSSRPLEQHCQVLLGTDAAALRDELEANDVIKRIVDRLIVPVAHRQEQL
jgi:hypothetical protein